MKSVILLVVLTMTAFQAMASSRLPVTKLGEIPWFMGNYEDVKSDLSDFWSKEMSADFAVSCLGNPKYPWTVQSSVAELVRNNLIRYGIYMNQDNKDLAELLTVSMSEPGKWLKANASRYQIKTFPLEGQGTLYVLGNVPAVMDNIAYERDLMFLAVNGNDEVEMFMVEGEEDGVHNCGRSTDDLFCVMSSKYPLAFACGTFDDT